MTESGGLTASAFFMTKVFTDYDAQTGIKTVVHETETHTAIEKVYDAQPFLETAKAMRAHTAGQRWGDVRHVGFIPMAELGKMMRQDGGFDRKRVLEFLKKNANLCTFEKFLK